jgi:periplasmic divalent cation tolerance protein
MQHFFVYMTFPDKDTASRIARTLVEERVAACANILAGAESIYWWNGAVEQATECICICKTSDEAYPALEARVRELHPYDTPCVVALPLERGAASFLRWIEEETLPGQH